MIPSCLRLELGRCFQHCGIVADFRKDTNGQVFPVSVPEYALVQLLAVSACCLIIAPDPVSWSRSQQEQ